MLSILLYTLAVYLVVCYLWGMYMGLKLILLGRRGRFESNPAETVVSPAALQAKPGNALPPAGRVAA